MKAQLYKHIFILDLSSLACSSYRVKKKKKPLTSNDSIGWCHGRNNSLHNSWGTIIVESWTPLHTQAVEHWPDGRPWTHLEWVCTSLLWCWTQRLALELFQTPTGCALDCLHLSWYLNENRGCNHIQHRDIWSHILPPNGFSLGHCRILAYSMQCSGSLGIDAIVHIGKLICGL